MMMKRMCPVHKVSALLVLVGALNWGLVGGFNWNLVSALLGSWPMAVRVVYILVGLAAIALLFKGKCKMCCKGGCCKEGSNCNCSANGCDCGMEHKM